MPSRFTKFELKMVVLEMLLQKSSVHKFNMLGRERGQGQLESKLGVSFTKEERSLASLVIDELKQAGLISPTYEENWLEITEAGRRALDQHALDDLDYALRELNPALCELRHGAESAIISDNPDSVRQAAHSTRELIRQALDILAPVDELRAQPDFEAAAESKSGVTRKMRIRHAMKKRHQNYSSSDTDIVELICGLIDALYNKLSAEAHRDIREGQKDVQDLIRSTETALQRLLL